jgi:WhiB family redox-sensing transcriptional regulator
MWSMTVQVAVSDEPRLDADFGFGGDDDELLWAEHAMCRGATHLFFAPDRERPGRRGRREAAARALCGACPVLEPCRTWARENREYGFWGGESEEERAAAGYRPALSSRLAVRYRAPV